MRLKSIREAKGVTRGELAGMLNTTIATISRWESGIHEPDLTTIVRLSKILDCTTDEIIKDAANPPQPLTGKKASRTGAQKGASVGV